MLFRSTVRSGGGSVSAVGDLTGVGKMIASGSGQINCVCQLTGIGFNNSGSPAIEHYYTNLLTLTT